MKKKTFLFLSVLVAAGAIAIVYFSSTERKQAVIFVTGIAQYGYIAKTVTATGTMQPLDTVSVGAQVSGVIKIVYVDFNSEVKQGQLLAKIDPSIIIAQTEQSRANLANAQSTLEYQQSNFERQDQLLNFGATSKAEYQLAAYQYNSAKAAVANASAQVRLDEKNLSYTNIYSPINGVVLNRSVSAGQTIASSFNAPTLFVIAKDLKKMMVRAAVDEADIGGVRLGQDVAFTVDAFPDDIFYGKVQQVLLRPTVSANVVTYTTLINFDNKEMKLKPGMTASINIYLEEDSNALLIPSKALHFKPDSALLKSYKIKKAPRNITGMDKDDKEKYTYRHASLNSLNKESAELRKSYIWVRTGDTLTEKKIITGINDDTYVKVIKGLSPDEEVITNVVTGMNKNNNNDISQRSPFMPQIRRRPYGSSRN